MTITKQIEKQASRIADAIVDLVERANGPVTLDQLARKISGFAAKEPPGFQYYFELDDRKVVIWDGMTEAGIEALRKVIRGRRVAVQFVSPVLYFLENCPLDDDQWWPIVLLPARAANLETPAFPLVRASQKQQDDFIKRAAAEGKPDNRLLTPGSVRYTADCFSL